MGLYEYLVMPMGLTNVLASFQALMNHVLWDHINKICEVYLDDILIYSKDPKEYNYHVKLVLQKLEEYFLKVDLDKSEFNQEEVEFLGHIIGKNGIHMDLRKVQSVLEWPTPKNLKDLQAFLGLANYYRRFIKSYSTIVTLLLRFTKKDVPFQWDEPAQKAFDALKEKFTTAPVLMVFDPTKPIYIETDASNYALGACLSQKDDQGCMHLVTFLSRKFSLAELNY